METKHIQANAARASGFLKSLANENRLAILCALADGERNVSELEALLGIRQPTLSQQLARLRANSLVATRRQSKRIFYRLASKEAESVIALVFELLSEDTGKGRRAGTAAGDARAA